MEKKTVLISGGTGGIGEALILKMAGCNYDVIFTCQKNIDKAEAILKDLQSKGYYGEYYSVDLTDSDQVRTMVSDIQKKHKKIDVLINNAGIVQDKLFLMMKKEEWDQVININLTAVFYITKEISKMMIKEKYGKIVNIASTGGIKGAVGQANYSTAKAALIGYTRSLAKELIPFNIWVNAVAPGYINTSMLNGLSPVMKQKTLESIPIKRFGEPSEVAELVYFLASDLSNYIVGQTIIIDGGLTI